MKSEDSATPSKEQLRNYCYFHNLSNSALEAIAKKLHIERISAGTEIIREGESADTFYFIKDGAVEVYKKTPSGQTSVLSVLGKGEGFGEMALLTSSLRKATVIAKTDLTLYKLFKIDFEEVVRLDSTFSTTLMEKAWGYDQFDKIKTLQPFALLRPEKMATIIAKLVEKRHGPGENIITQGEKGDFYYIVKSGRVAVLKKMLEDEPEHVATLGPGEGFGEEALITDSPRSATVRTIDDTVLWALSRTDFERVMKSSFLEEVSPEEIPSEKNSQPDFLDVRMKMEFEEEHIPEAINIPLDELRRRYSELDYSKEYYVYCLLGVRSATAAFLLTSNGFKVKGCPYPSATNMNMRQRGDVIP
jgi:CRP-like cAMP-binding protein